MKPTTQIEWPHVKRAHKALNQFGMVSSSPGYEKTGRVMKPDGTSFGFVIQFSAHADFDAFGNRHRYGIPWEDFSWAQRLMYIAADERNALLVPVERLRDYFNEHRASLRVNGKQWVGNMYFDYHNTQFFQPTLRPYDPIQLSDCVLPLD